MATLALSHAVPRGKRRPRTMPGFGLSLGVSLFYAGLVIVLPLAAMAMRTMSLGLEDFLAIVTSDRAVATYRITLTAAGIATAFNAAFGLLLAWVLTRYDFAGRRVLDALVDLPFALPTAVAGLVLVTLFAPNGWYGRFLVPMGIEIAYAPLGIAVAMAFTSIPFVVRTVQPVLEDLSREVEEAADSLGASALQRFRLVIFPAILPAFLAGTTLAFARSLGEFGAIVFIAGNLPFRTEVTSLLVYIRLDEFNYASAAALAMVMLAVAFVLLLAVNLIQGLMNAKVNADATAR